MELKEIEKIIHDEIDWNREEELKLRLSGSDGSYYQGLNSGLNVVLYRLGLPKYKCWFDEED